MYIYIQIIEFIISIRIIWKLCRKKYINVELISFFKISVELSRDIFIISRIKV